MIKKNILIIDKLVTGYNHVVFNASFSAIIAKIFSDQTITFIAESIHSDVVSKKNANVVNLQYQPYTEPSIPNGGFRKILPWLGKKNRDRLFIRSLYEKLTPNDHSIFFTCLSTSSLVFAGKGAKHLKIPVYFFLHGEIEYLFKTNNSNASSFRAKLFRLFFRNIGKTSRVVVLSKIIKEKLIEEKLLTSDQIIVVEHPVMPVEFKDLKPPEVGKKKIFGHLGIALHKKSSYLFFELAKFNRSAIMSTQAAFFLVGRIENGLELDNSDNNVEVLAEGNMALTQEVFERGIASIDYAVFTFSEENYVYRISGSVMDAIAFSKPIIALKHPYFIDLFERAGNIGFLCDNLETLNQLLNKIIQDDVEILSQYKIQQRNLEALLQKQSVNEIYQALNSSLRRDI